MVLLAAAVNDVMAQARVMVAGGEELPVLDDAARTTIIDSVSATINEVYVFPEVAKKMTDLIKKQNKNKAYAELTSPIEFTDRLTEDLRSVCHDKHLGVQYVTDEMIARFTNEDEEQNREREIAEAQYDNYNFRKIERLSGNIGYLKFNGFSATEGAGRTAIAAMNFLAYVDALIVDLRDNGGGSPAMIQTLSSYLFDDPVHLNSFYLRKEDSIKQFWTQPFVDGPRLSNTPVYILTSNYTFSGAEEFTYNLKNLKRATIIGETTGGGAHPVQSLLHDSLNVVVRVPFGRAINPITGTNWEGTGVEPDIKTTADSAYDVAYLEALKKVQETTADENKRAELGWYIAGLNARRNPVMLTETELSKYAGEYGPRKVWLENGVLLYQREDRPIYRMYVMGENLFGIEELEYFRIQFVPDENGEYNELIGLYSGGQRDGNKRTR